MWEVLTIGMQNVWTLTNAQFTLIFKKQSSMILKPRQVAELLQAGYRMLRPRHIPEEL